MRERHADPRRRRDGQWRFAGRTARVALAMFLSALAGPVAAVPVGELAGRQARYEVASRSGALPAVDELYLGIVVGPPIDGVDHVWFQMEMLRSGERQWAVALLVPGLGFLEAEGAPVPVARYVLFPRRGVALEYVDRNTGVALLPAFGFFERLLPRGGIADGDDPFPFQGGACFARPLRRLEAGEGAEPLPVDTARRLELDPEVLVGTARTFRDDGTGPHASVEDLAAGRAGDYTYVPLDADDYRRMMDAGMNLFRVPASRLPLVVEEPVFFHLENGFEHEPELLYRSNFRGAVMYMDEPVIRAYVKRMLHREESPAAAAEAIVELTRGRFRGDGPYGAFRLDRILREAGWDLGPEPLPQTDYPVWEAAASGAWYELEAGAGGWCHQGRYDPDRFADLVESVLGVEFPRDAESLLALHLGLFTGAARRFGAPWGIGIYGQMDDRVADVAFERAWERGARYFWLWTSDRGHHVPFERQLELTSRFRDWRESRPPRGERSVRTAAARRALAIPWGYPLDIYALQQGWGHREPRLWGSELMRLDAHNGDGIEYREVLAAAFREAAALLADGDAFDVVFLRSGETIEGYDEIRRVADTGEVR